MQHEFFTIRYEEDTPQQIRRLCFHELGSPAEVIYKLQEVRKTHLPYLYVAGHSSEDLFEDEIDTFSAYEFLDHWLGG